MKKIKFGSVCSGIEAASVAWNPLGWEAAWLSEIEPFPSAVLAHHYPTVPNLGDMTKLPERILSGEVEAPDVFCGGTPCQAFSVAGLRNSLDDARGNLSLTFVGIANAIDHVRSVRRDDPAIIFWENVPGVLSTKDNAFGCFLAGLAGEDNPLEPPRGKWTNSGYVLGPKRAVAWRLLDAQYFGVAQRRKRVFVVASARADFDPAAVLFEFNGVRRDSAPSRETGQKPTASLVPSVAGSLDTECGGGKLTHQSVSNGHLIGTITARMFNALGFQDVQAGAIMAVVSPALNTCSGSNHAPDTKAYVVHGTQDPCVSDIAFAQGRNNGGENVLAYTTKMHNTQSNQAGKFYEEYSTSLDANSPPPAVFQPIALQDVTPREKAQNGRGWNDDGTAYTVDTHATQGVAQPIDFRNLRFHEGDVAGTMQAKSSGGYSLNYETGVMQPIPINSMNAFRSPDADPTTGCGIGESGEAMFTITKTNSHAVAQPIAFSRNDDGRDATTDLSPTMRVAGRAGGMLGVAQPMVLMDQGGSVMNVEHDMVGTLRRETHGHEPVVMQPVVAMRESGLGYWMEDTVAGTLDANMGMSGHANRPAVMTVPQAMAVRRLTPVECERLQGFPDNYTNIPWRKKDESPDGPRYKALGNSWAVPNVRWIGQRIQREMEKNDL